jgi:hypothetical protein
MNVCSECHVLDGHKFSCSQRPGKGARIPVQRVKCPTQGPHAPHAWRISPEVSQHCVGVPPQAGLLTDDEKMVADLLLTTQHEIERKQSERITSLRPNDPGFDHEAWEREHPFPGSVTDAQARAVAALLQRERAKAWEGGRTTDIPNPYKEA